MQVFSTPLEKVEPFNNFVDFCSTFRLTHGKNVEDESDIVGEFKVPHRSINQPIKQSIKKLKWSKWNSHCKDH